MRSDHTSRKCEAELLVESKQSQKSSLESLQESQEVMGPTV